MNILAKAVLPLTLALASCGSLEPETTTTLADKTPQASTDNLVPKANAETIVHATVRLGEDHQVQFVEYPSGMVGLIETGRTMQDVPRVTDEIAKLSWREQYRHFAGAKASFSKAMESALARSERLPQPTEPISDPDSVLPNAASGPHFYTAGEQEWFRQNFCNGSQQCMQGFDFTNMQSAGKLSNVKAFGMIGSEGPANGTMTQFFWKCVYGGIFAGWFCAWMQNGQVVIVPGHFVVQTQGGNGSWFFRWELRGGGANTLVSSSFFSQ